MPISRHFIPSRRNEDELHRYATEKVFPEMMNNVSRKTLHWEFIKSLEPPRVVQVRTQDVLTKNNVFAQITVRFNSQQVLAVYDRFGRLIHGNPTVAKDVLEYVVFEKHMANVYGEWRIHGKIIPEWMEEKPKSRVTYVMPKEVVDSGEEASASSSSDEGRKATVPPARGEDEVAQEETETTLYDRFGKAIGKEKQ